MNMQSATPVKNIRRFHPFIRLTAAASLVGAVVIPAALGGRLQPVALQWRWTTHRPPQGWNAPAFDASSWKTGTPGFGCRRGLPEEQQKQVRTTWETPDIWVRAEFNLDEEPFWAVLRYSHDEDVEIFLNGREIVRRPGYITNWREELLTGARAEALHRGRNIIAAHCRQTVGGQFLDLQLAVYTGALPPVAETKHPPRPEYPRPDFVREEWKNLNGPWQFEIDPERKGVEEHWEWGRTFSRTIIVPFPPESRLSGIGNTDFMRHVWYRRAVRIPAAWKGKRILLHFGAVDFETAVWVNGLRMGGHRGGYTPFSFDITDAIVHDIADIVVLADDPMDSGSQPTGKQARSAKWGGCIYTRTTGIWQTVWLEPVPEVRLDEVRIIPDVPNAQILVQPRITGNPGDDARLGIRVSWKGRTVRECSVRPRDGLFHCVRLADDPNRLHLWEPGAPALYDIEFTLYDGKRELDRVRSYFGMRSVAVSGRRILINGRPVFQRLVLDQGYYPDGIYTAPTDEALRRDIELAMKFGFNGARLHMKVFEPRFLYWADRLGYIVWGEFPNWGLNHRAAAAMAEHLSEWVEAVRRDINHPAIVGWCPFNETPENQDAAAIRRCYFVTKAMDPTRPVIDTSGFTHVVTDVYDCHNYTQNPDALSRFFADFAKGGAPWHNRAREAPYRGQPFMVSEFGGTRWRKGKNGWGYGNAPASQAEFLERFRGLVTVLLRHPRMAGFCYTQLYDIEQEQNGLCTYDRKPKFSPEVIRAILAQPAAIEESGR